MVTKLLAPANTLTPRDVTDVGIVNDVIPLRANAHVPIDVTPVEIVIETNEVHRIKAKSPMVLTLIGIMTDSKDVDA
jgi:hypothetical protein